MAWRHRSQRSVNAGRVLAVDLFQHEDSAVCAGENLGAEQAPPLERAQAKGRQLALELPEPWRAGA